MPTPKPPPFMKDELLLASSGFWDSDSVLSNPEDEKYRILCLEKLEELSLATRAASNLGIPLWKIMATVSSSFFNAKVPYEDEDTNPSIH